MSLEQNENRILLDRYQLLELVGTGAMGQVYRAGDQLLGGVVVAVKFLSQTLLNDKMRERFEKEATISALLGEKTIHIIRVRDYGIDENKVPFYVMEFLEGKSLSEVLKFRALPIDRFLGITRQICLGMESAHSGISIHGELAKVIHRDIKPSNVYLVEDNTLGELVKILDFGIAKLVQADATQTHSFMGTLAYCSPEQMEGKELDNRSDIYSLGIMMYEMLTLDMPILPETSSFGGWYKAHHEFKPFPFDSDFNIPDELKDIIFKCIEKSPDKRPQEMGEILRIIEALEKYYKNSDKEISSFKKRKIVYSENTTQVSKKIGKSSDYETETQLTWPHSKPKQKIVFPRLLTIASETCASLWVMLNKEDIINRMSSIRYNQFLFLNSPHPMVLWITVIYNKKYSARWLPCYLDLKTEVGQQVTEYLANLGTYKILFFALEEPESCQHKMTSTIAPSQCSIMKEWVESSKSIPNPRNPQASKDRLKQELKKLKPKILSKLQESNK